MDGGGISSSSCHGEGQWVISDKFLFTFFFPCLPVFDFLTRISLDRATPLGGLAVLSTFFLLGAALLGSCWLFLASVRGSSSTVEKSYQYRMGNLSIWAIYPYHLIPTGIRVQYTTYTASFVLTVVLILTDLHHRALCQRYKQCTCDVVSLACVLFMYL